MKVGVPKKGKRCSTNMLLDTCSTSSPHFIGYADVKNEEFGATRNDWHCKSKSLSNLHSVMPRENMCEMDPSWRSGLVLKFGGSSVGEMPALCHVLDIITKEALNNDELLVVIVSAPGPTTDWLIDASTLATSGDIAGALEIVDRIADLCVHNAFSASNGGPSIATPVRHLLVGLKRLLEGVSLTRECTPRALDMILSFGERLSALMMGWLLSWRGISRGVAVIDSREWLITGQEFGNASVHRPESYHALRMLRPSWGDRIAVMTGFIGRTRDGGYTTTLGRNGSDLTATLAGTGLQVRKVVINTDVKGVHTADPSIVPTAVPVKKLSYELCLELAIYSSARLFHSRTMIPLISSGIPMAIRSTQDINGPCTIICNEELCQLEGDGTHPTCVTSLECQSILEVHYRMEKSKDSLGSRILNALQKSSINVSLGIQAAHGQSFSVVIPNDYLDIAKRAVLEEFRAEYDSMEVGPLVVREGVTMLSVVLDKLMETKGVGLRFVSALSRKGIDYTYMATGPRSLSCIIDAKDTVVAVRAVHDAFHFSKQLSLVAVYDSDDVDIMENLFHLLKGGAVEALNVVVVGAIKVTPCHGCAKDSISISDGSYSPKEQQCDPSFECLYCPEGIVDFSTPEEYQSTIAYLRGEIFSCSSLAGKNIVSLSALELLQCVSKLPLPVLVDCRRSFSYVKNLDQIKSMTWGEAVEPLCHLGSSDSLLGNDINLAIGLELGINIISINAVEALKVLDSVPAFGRCTCENSLMGSAHFMCNTAITSSAFPMLEMLRGVLKVMGTPVKMEICFGGSLGDIFRRCDTEQLYTLPHNNSAEQDDVKSWVGRITDSCRQPFPYSVEPFVSELSGRSEAILHELACHKYFCVCRWMGVTSSLEPIFHVCHLFYR